ncbi:MAG: hypothetical protein LVQ95_03485 [Candidatus Micrarchaeales archaeon]|nr:hypothetical protein [Candidatus Micrarchaeales archaeon]
MGGESKEKQQETLAGKFREVFGLIKEAPNIGPPKNASDAISVARDGVIRTVNYNSPTTSYRQREIEATRKKSSGNKAPIDPLILTDLFYSNYLPYSRVKVQEETTASPLHRAIVDAANTSDYRDKLRAECLGNVTTSMAAAIEMSNVLLDELQNMARFGNQSQKEAAQQLLDSLKKGAQLGDDVSKQLQEQVKRQQKKWRKEGQGDSSKKEELSRDDKEKHEDGEEEKREEEKVEKQDGDQGDGQERKKKGIKPQESDDAEGKKGKSELPFHLPVGLPFGKNSNRDENGEQSAQDGSASGSSEGQQQEQEQSQFQDEQTGATQNGISQRAGTMPGGARPSSSMQERESDGKTGKKEGDNGEMSGKKSEPTKKGTNKNTNRAPETGGISGGMPTQEAPQAPAGIQCC